MAIKKTCRICGDCFHVPPKQASRAYCDREACQTARRRRINIKEQQRYRLVKKGKIQVKRKKLPDSGRHCRRCGKNAFPNYFFCPECHQYVTRNEWQCEEEEKASCACH